MKKYQHYIDARGEVLPSQKHRESQIVVFLIILTIFESQFLELILR